MRAKGETAHALSFCRKERSSLPKPKLDNPMQAIVFVSLIGADLAVSVLVGFWVGRYLDRLLATDPWLMLLGVLLGLAAGVYSVYLLIRAYL